MATDVVLAGACAHGADFVALDRTVVFYEDCPEDCADVLREDGYTVRVTREGLALSR